MLHTLQVTLEQRHGYNHLKNIDTEGGVGNELAKVRPGDNPSFEKPDSVGYVSSFLTLVTEGTCSFARDDFAGESASLIRFNLRRYIRIAIGKAF